MPKRWPIELEQKLISLSSTGQYTYKEISALIGKNPSAVAQKAFELGIKNDVYLKRISKHAHLREKVIKFFQTHSAKETCYKFKLTYSEFKSCITAAYKDGSLKKYRKDKRVRRPWTHKERTFLIERLGLRERRWIAKKLKRSKTSYHTVKEELCRLGVSHKQFHGLSAEPAALLFGDSISEYFITTKAGPGPQFRLKIIPWVTIERLSKEHNLDAFWQSTFALQAKLQRWIYRAKTERQVVSKIKRIIGEK